MRALYAAGRQAEALEAFRHARAVLVERGRRRAGPGAAAPARGDAAAGSGARAAAAAAAPARVRGDAFPRALVLAAAVAVLAGGAAFAVSRIAAPDSLDGIDENASAGSTPPMAISSPSTSSAASRARSPPEAARSGSPMRRTRRFPGSSRAATASSRSRSGPIPCARVRRRRPVGGRARRRHRRSDQPGVEQGDPAHPERQRPERARRRLRLGLGRLRRGSDRVTSLRRPTGPSGVIHLGAPPSAIAAGAGAVWITSEETGTLFRVEPRTGTVVRAIRVGNRPGRRRRRRLGGVGGEPAGRDGLADRSGDQQRHRHDRGRARPRARSPCRRPGVWVATADARRVADRRADAPRRRDGRAWKPPGGARRRWRVRVGRDAADRGAPSRRHGERRERRSSTIRTSSRGPTSRSRSRSCRWPTTGWSPTGAPGARRSGRWSPTWPPTFPSRAPTGGRTCSPCAAASASRTGRRSSRRTSAPRWRTSCGATAGSCRASSTRSSGRGAAFASRRACDLSSGIVTDARERTITLRLTRPDPYLLYKLASPLAYVAPAGHPSALDDEPPGTGPYRVDDFEPGRGVELTRNPYFRVWSQDARPDGLADRILVRVSGDDRAKRRRRRTRRSRRGFAGGRLRRVRPSG